MRYKLSCDGVGLLKRIGPDWSKDFYHIHSDEMTLLERLWHCALRVMSAKN
ncbi:hypothetical protein LCGC14_0298380 [marine sediment metagenome]|uniref:Uncharacterized protein n=1 Tax=marine sediment metagenome TaxID=412755 RepID=A0A0F9WX57_9ZZZZ